MVAELHEVAVVADRVGPSLGVLAVVVVVREAAVPSSPLAVVVAELVVLAVEALVVREAAVPSSPRCGRGGRRARVVVLWWRWSPG